MRARLEKIFYILSAVVLSAGLFVLSDSAKAAPAQFKDEIRKEFSIAFLQLMNGEPLLSPVEDVLNGIAGFYMQSADELVVLLSQPESDEDIIYVFGSVYKTFAAAFDQRPPQVAGISEVELVMPPNFMQEPPVYNIIPTDLDTISSEEPKIAGAAVLNEKFDSKAGNPMNSSFPWVTLRDNITGELYCTAIYNGEVNKYVGECKNEEYK